MGERAICGWTRDQVSSPRLRPSTNQDWLMPLHDPSPEDRLSDCIKCLFLFRCIGRCASIPVIPVLILKTVVGSYKSKRIEHLFSLNV
jgi:hypothetical protein